ncbi:hypothetical protein [Variovorax sp. GT1P44]|uniref:hypothetical protein n=1 Tax=Variovorax sp. GT1P44 TaxID=3443742 RepID=UPI003F477294
MNLKPLITFCCLYALLAAHAAELQAVSISEDGNFVSLKTSDSQTYHCKLKGAVSGSSDSMSKVARLSFDHSAVVIDNSHYLAVAEIKKCGARPLTLLRAAPSAGLLADINLSAGIYVSLDVVALSPLSFLATVSKIYKDENLVNLPGVYKINEDLYRLQKYAFSFNESDPPVISRDGRYVSVGGAPDCSIDAFPGVWKIDEGARVIFKRGGTEEIKKKCNALFQTGENVQPRRSPDEKHSCKEVPLKIVQTLTNGTCIAPL